jgi:alanyl-tRNA synthetase
MFDKRFTGAEIRKTFIDYFIERGHTFVPSSSLVPGGDQTLLFTNAGMVQFKDVFLGIDTRPYTRATNSQKCMRVAGKHNDLEDVGFDDTHHTFFEMLGNWSFGDYYKKEAIEWAWDLLTGVWGLPKDRLWATCFEDEKGEIERDEEAANHWCRQPGFDSSHILFFGRKDNFWEMADTGPCGPNSEIHLDLGAGHCSQEGQPDHECKINLDGCTRFTELWNLVFIQYNRIGSLTLEDLPAKHVDTGLGFDRTTAVLQGVDSNYKTDLLKPIMDAVQELTGHTSEEVDANYTPYRVIADHARAATFLIADGVVPGNTGRNYVSRMIIRRAARFGNLIGLDKPFLASVAERVIMNYGDFYPELARNRAAILDNLYREEKRFQRTVEAGVSKLEDILANTHARGSKDLQGEKAFDLYATYGLPLEITRDIAREQGIQVDEQGFLAAMEEHRLASGAGEVFGVFGEDKIELYNELLTTLVDHGELNPGGVNYDPYDRYEVEGKILALIKDGELIDKAGLGDQVEILLPDTCFYVEAGGQVSDTGNIVSAADPAWEIEVNDIHQPVRGVIVHIGEVIRGEPRTGDQAIARINYSRRRDIMRNHTATHLLHAELRAVLGDHARQAGSLVAPDRLRFDFTHPEALSLEQLDEIEAGVNQMILDNSQLKIAFKSLQEATAEGATALFGEKYGETVRTITIGGEVPYSYELCGGTHVSETGDIGTFLITTESSVGAGLRRIEAVTGRGSYELIHHRFTLLSQTADLLGANPENVIDKTHMVLAQLEKARKRIASLQKEMISQEFNRLLDNVTFIDEVAVLATRLPGADANTLRQMTDRFRQRYKSGAVLLASVYDGRPLLVASLSNDLVKRGLHAGELVKFAAQPLGGSGGGRPNLAQAGGKDPSHLNEALKNAETWFQDHLR